jgi:hypothetical protein
MKKSVSVVVLIVGLMSIISLRIIYAGDCEVRPRADCQTAPWSNIVMGVSAVTNAHGEFPDKGTYAYVLCCNFGGGEKSCSNDPHPVYGSNVPKNKIIGLYSDTNAHAEATGATNYPVEVCYKDLICVSTNSKCEPQYPQELLNLSGQTNAHIGEGSQYDLAICCKSSESPSENCDLTSAHWEQNSVLEGNNIDMIVEGTGCNGASIEFSIYEDDPLADDFVTKITGVYDTGVWKSVWKHTGDDDLGNDPRTYYFIAKAVLSGDRVTSQNPKLRVSEVSDLYCSTISLCSDYSSASECGTDSCDVSSEYEQCTGTDSCSCIWNSGSGICEFATIYNSEEDVACENGYTLCYHSTSGLKYCFPGSSCSGDNVPEDSDSICDFGEGCTSSDCSDGDQDSCVEGAKCKGGKCFVQGETPESMEGCNSGYTFCRDPVSQLKYCYPGNKCRSGHKIPEDSDSICDFGEGCTSSDCSDGDQDSCLGGAYCSDGACYSSSKPQGTCYYEQTVIDKDCSDGYLEYAWTARWVGTGLKPQSCSDKSKTLPCSGYIQAPFFDSFSMIWSAIAIALIYGFILLRKKEL